MMRAQICYSAPVTILTAKKGWDADTSETQQKSQEKNMANAYTSPEAANVEKRRWGQKLTVAGAVIAGFGILGIVLATVLKITWVLGFVGGPLGGLAWLAVLVGGGLFVYGFLQIKSAHENRPL
jgi:hypothetical protein